MLTKKRQQLILKILEQKKAVTVAELTEALDASESTIRRDLVSLDKMKKLYKVHGGATILDKDVNTKEDAVATKALLNIEEKDIIAKYAASLIQDNDFVFIDSGTTTLKMIEFIKNKKATFVTNGIVHAKKLIENNLKAYMIGGQIKPITEAIVGAECVENIQKYHFTKAFMGTNGISVDCGFTTPDIDEALVKTAAIEHTYMPYVLADHTKFGNVSSVSFTSLENCCIITDKLTDKKYSNYTIIKALL